MSLFDYSSLSKENRQRAYRLLRRAGSVRIYQDWILEHEKRLGDAMLGFVAMLAYNLGDDNVIRDGMGTPLTAGDIAERRGVSRRTVMQYINQLIKEGWLEPRKFGIGTGYYLSPKIAVRDADRNSPAAASWKLGVLDRDNWTCRDCGETENLHCHHIKSWWDHPEDRFDINNGITLCKSCHAAKHPDVGFLSG